MWPFRKKTRSPAPPVDRRIWNEDWRIGDIAECVSDRFHESVEPWERPNIGDRLIVTGFSEGLGASGDKLHYFLHFAELPTAFSTNGFRKVRPVSAKNSEIATRILNAKPGADKVREGA